MKKFYTLITILLLSVIAVQADKGIKLTFKGANSASVTTDGTVSGITVTPSALGNEDVSNVTASLVSITGNFPGFMTTGVFANGTLIGPSNESGDNFWGGTNSANKTATLTFKISGIANVLSSFSKVGVGLEATTGSAGYQGNDVNRSFTFTTAYSQDNTTYTNINTVSTANFATGENGDRNNRNYNHYDFEASSDISSSEALYLQITINKTDANGCFWGLEDITITQPEYTVTWNIKENESDSDPLVSFESTTTKGSSATLTLPTYPYTEISAPEGSEATISEGVATVSNVTGNKDVTLIATFSTPFTASTDYESATWYYLKAGRGTHYAYYDPTKTNIKTGENLNTKNHKWAFIGNPINGYKVINKAAGKSLFAYAQNGTNGQMLSMNTSETIWNIVDGSNDAGNSFTFSLKGTSGGYWNSYDTAGEIGMWKDGTTDSGSRWLIETASNFDGPFNGTYLRLKNKNTNAYLYSPTIGSTSSITTSESSGIETIWYFHYGSSTSDKGYLLSYYSGEYVSTGSKSGGNGTQDDVSISTNLPASSAKGLQIGNSDNGLIIYQMNNGWWYLQNETAENNVTSVKGVSSTNEDKYNWTMEEVTSLPVTLHKSGDKYYGTLALPVAVDVPSGTTAYAVGADFTKSDGTKAVPLTSIGTTIPANTAVVLINENTDNSTETTLTINVNVSDNTSATLPTGVTNNLQPILTATPYADNSNYYLGQSNGTPGFYQVTNGSSRYLTNKGYLASSTTSTGGSKGFAFAFGGDDDPTGISSATGETDATAFDADAPRYNLQGQRVGKDYKGIVVVNGRKYLLK